MSKNIYFSIIAIVAMNANAGRFDLHDACKEGRLTDLQKIIKADPNSVDRYDQNNETPLTIACKQNNLELMKRLIEAKANLYTKDKDSNALLYSLIRTACENENVEMLEKLFFSSEIHRWWKWEIKDGMIVVIETGNVQGLLCLIAFLEPSAEDDIAYWLRHYNINVNDDRCCIMLEKCIKNKNLEMLDFLLKNEFFINIDGIQRGLDNALITAVENNNIEAIKKFLQYCKDNSVNIDSSSLLLLAMKVENPSIDMVSYLLNIKANPNYWNSEYSSLSKAAEKGNMAIFQKLKNAGASIEFTQCRNRPKSIERAPYFYCKDKHKLNPLLLAAKNGHTDIVKQLLFLKADPMAIGDNHTPEIIPHRITPLYMALINGHTDCVKAMFRLNNAKHNDLLQDKNILESCIQQERWLLLTYLLEQAPELFDNALEILAINNKQEMLHSILRKTQTNVSYKTATKTLNKLNVDDVESIIYLLEYGANLGIRGNFSSGFILKLLTPNKITESNLKALYLLCFISKEFSEKTISAIDNNEVKRKHIFQHQNIFTYLQAYLLQNQCIQAKDICDIDFNPNEKASELLLDENAKSLLKTFIKARIELDKQIDIQQIIEKYKDYIPEEFKIEYVNKSV